jgi:hypothetical protein
MSPFVRRLIAILLAGGPLWGLLAGDGAISGAGGPAAPPPGAGPGATPAAAARPVTRPALPQTPGFHNLFYTGRLLGQERKLAYVLYLPKGYDPNRPWPMVLYLCGLGERGNNHEGVYGNGRRWP